jgi:hypothetical protein
MADSNLKMQSVTVVQVADRHADLHERQFARAQEVAVPAGDLRAVITAAMHQVDAPDEPGRFVITIDWPHDV